MATDPTDPRRLGPRVPLDSLCTELHGGSFRHALVVDVSEDGLRIERPFGGPRSRQLQLELEIPGVDEIGWAAAEVCFDEVRRGAGGTGIIRTSGLRLVSAAQRHRRILREYVLDTWRELRREADIGAYLVDASCYLRG
ncbi:MAG TPA: PilZ domain-containing protein [Kofleriaceae bacterium]|jgi:hypothetical protein|nr:PilZ domain-containing protein [Kofleriaceae bacterium]